MFGGYNGEKGLMNCVYVIDLQTMVSELANRVIFFILMKHVVNNVHAHLVPKVLLFPTVFSALHCCTL